MSKVAIVTGAGRGIGAATAERLAQDGFDVVVNYRHTAEGAETVATTVKAFGQRALIAKADVARLDEVDAMIASTMQELGRLDAIVNNAGVYQRSAVDKLDMADWHDALDINLSGAFHVVRAGLPHLQPGARVVNVSSMIASVGSRHAAHYGAAKGGVEALTRALAVELAPRGILVNCVAPGSIATDMLAGDSPEKRRERERAIPLGRLGDASDVAGVVSFLLGPDSSYVTGQVLKVNGGLDL